MSSRGLSLRRITGHCTVAGDRVTAWYQLAAGWMVEPFGDLDVWPPHVPGHDPALNALVHSQSVCMNREPWVTAVAPALRVR